jgi:hypothetical protein
MINQLWESQTNTLNTSKVESSQIVHFELLFSLLTPTIKINYLKQTFHFPVEDTWSICWLEHVEKNWKLHKTE